MAARDRHGGVPQVKIISGGQTGVDRAALDFAMRRGMEHGGWCPRGRTAEDGPIDPKYALRETDSPEYGARTARNVSDSDATLIVVRERRLTGGTALTRDAAAQLSRPALVVCEEDGVASGAAGVAAFVKENGVETLNIAGPRESEAPGLERFVVAVLEAAFPQAGV